MPELKQVSSLEKVFPRHEFNAEEIRKMTVLHGEEGAYQIAFKEEHAHVLEIEVKSDIKEFIRLYTVDTVPVMLPTYESAFSDPDYISTEPGLYPDILTPVGEEVTASGFYSSLWVEVKKGVPVGEHRITVTITGKNGSESREMEYTVLSAELPESDLIFTQWFHTDCISDMYNAPVWSEELWERVEQFVKLAAENGMNMILTPLFTPPLDTEIGKERPTVQLVGIKKDGDRYTFDFSLLERWVKMCEKHGIRYFEAAHLFTQWGAKCTPKIIAEENGEKKRIFGWDVAATDERYEIFLSQFLPAVRRFFEERGLSDRVYFHISDEPNPEVLEDYMRAKSIACKYLEGCKIIDALSDYEFFEKGVTERPIVATTHIDDFIGKTDELWGYYCCAQVVGVSNRMIAMPSARNRYIALQFYKYRVKGFLQWGYNFYYTRLSKRKVNPFFETDCGGEFPSGDGFSVYPGKDGPLKSLRLSVFHHALQDLAAMKLLEKYVGYDRVLEIIEGLAGEVRFAKCTSDSGLVIKIRGAINEELMRVMQR